MGKFAFSRATVAVCSLLCGLLPSCDWSDKGGIDTQSIRDANAVLSSRDLPVLPTGVTIVRCWTGGTFAKHMNVKFTASPDQALDYLRRANATYYLEFQIEGKKYRILATHSLTVASGNTDRPDLWMLIEKAGIHSQPWFRSIYDIRHGWYYHHYELTDAPVSHYMFYDVDTQQFYVYWTYS